MNNGTANSLTAQKVPSKPLPQWLVNQKQKNNITLRTSLNIPVKKNKPYLLTMGITGISLLLAVIITCILIIRKKRSAG